MHQANMWISGPHAYSSREGHGFVGLSRKEPGLRATDDRVGTGGMHANVIAIAIAAAARSLRSGWVILSDVESVHRSGLAGPRSIPPTRALIDWIGVAASDFEVRSRELILHSLNSFFLHQISIYH